MGHKQARQSKSDVTFPGSLLNGINGKKLFFFFGLPAVFYFNFFTASVHSSSLDAKLIPPLYPQRSLSDHHGNGTSTKFA